ncbi:MAG TPA: ABC transporter permease [Candidatus Binatia bacterium]|nr:ABC transporter permease [Candidatus Binatia bacterium]
MAQRREATLTRETLVVALEALRANKLKAALTMLGVVIGSACIVLTVTIALTGKEYIVSTVEAVGSNLVYAQVVRAGPGQRAVPGDELSMEDLDAIREGIPGIREVAGSREINMAVVFNGEERAVTLTGVTAGFQSIRNLVVLRGRFLDADDMEARAKVCTLTEELAARVFPGRDPVGLQVRVGELHFTVVGVFRERSTTFGQSEIQKETVVIPLTLLKYYLGEDFIRVIYAQAPSAQEVPAVTRQVAEILRARHRPGAVYRVENLGGILDTVQKISLALTIVLLLIGFIALVISGIGIMNIMLVTVTERTREIGVRMAVGAPRREIRWQFLLEALIISGAGALAGILFAVSLPLAMKPFLPRSFAVSVSWISVLVSFLVTCLTGVLFGYLPANRAAGLQPTESLRYE